MSPTVPSRRVSTNGQTLATQKALLKAAGVERVFSERVSGVTVRRPELDRVLDSLRLATCAGFRLLADRWTNTTTAAGRLMVTVLSGIAEFERDLILQRTSEGRARAMAEGKRFGRRPKLTKHQAHEALKRVAAGEPLREVALSYAVDHSTISRLKARHAAAEV